MCYACHAWSSPPVPGVKSPGVPGHGAVAGLVQVSCTQGSALISTAHKRTWEKHALSWSEVQRKDHQSAERASAVTGV